MGSNKRGIIRNKKLRRKLKQEREGKA